MEKGYKEDLTAKEGIKLAVETLMEVVESSKNIEICVMHPDSRWELLDDSEIDKFVKEIEKEREEETQKKKVPESK